MMTKRVDRVIKRRTRIVEFLQNRANTWDRDRSLGTGPFVDLCEQSTVDLTKVIEIERPVDRISPEFECRNRRVAPLKLSSFVERPETAVVLENVRVLVDVRIDNGRIDNGRIENWGVSHSSRQNDQPACRNSVDFAKK